MLIARVGLPQGLLHYQYGPVWERFFTNLGVETVTSGDTTKEMVECGCTLDEICLPAKAYFGHVQKLRQQVDYLFVPRIVSVSRAQYSCPKIIGMPDLLRTNISNLPPIIDIDVNLRRQRSKLFEAVAAVGRVFGKSPLTSIIAWYKAWHQKQTIKEMPLVYSKNAKVALIGHPYLIYDRHLSMNVIVKLEQLGVSVITPDMVDAREAELGAKSLGKKIFWSNSHHLAGAAIALIQSCHPVDGMIFMTCFSCGPDALIGEIIRCRAERNCIPYMTLSVDEHTAEAGFVTRLEAFTDMLERRCRM